MTFPFQWVRKIVLCTASDHLVFILRPSTTDLTSSTEFISRALTHLHLVPHTCVSELGWSISSGNGLSPVRRQAITWTNAGLLSIGLMRTNFNEIRMCILSFPFKKMHLKLSSAKRAAILSKGRWGNTVPWPWDVDSIIHPNRSQTHHTHTSTYTDTISPAHPSL